MPKRLVNFVPPAGFNVFKIPQTLNIRTPDFNREILIGGSIELSFSAVTGINKGRKEITQIGMTWECYVNEDPFICNVGSKL